MCFPCGIHYFLVKLTKSTLFCFVLLKIQQYSIDWVDLVQYIMVRNTSTNGHRLSSRFGICRLVTVVLSEKFLSGPQCLYVCDEANRSVLQHNVVATLLKSLWSISVFLLIVFTFTENSFSSLFLDRLARWLSVSIEKALHSS